MANQTYQLAISYNCGGQFAQNVWHYQLDDSGYSTSKSAAQALISRWDTVNRGTLRQVLSASVTIVGYKASCVSASGGFEAHLGVSASNAGTRAGALSASGLSPVIIHYPVNLSLGRGRSFLPGVSENDADDGIFTTNFRSAMVTCLNTLFDPIVLVGGGAPTATFGYFRRPSKVFVALANSIMSETIGTQRRRMRPV